ncbi:MAG: hypothetical protein WDW36_005443 [Sanguina aurantia]
MGIGASTPSVDLQLQQSAVGIAAADNSTSAMPSTSRNATAAAVPAVTAQSAPTTLPHVIAIGSPPPPPDMPPPVKAASSPASEQYNGVPSAPVGDGEGTRREYMG